MIEPAVNPRAMIEYIAKEIVEAKAEVIVDEYEDGDETVIELEGGGVRFGQGDWALRPRGSRVAHIF